MLNTHLVSLVRTGALITHKNECMCGLPLNLNSTRMA